MRAMLKYLHSPDVPDLETWNPAAESFGVLVQTMIGSFDGVGEESFDVFACSPHWLATETDAGSIRSGQHTILMPQHNYRLLRDHIEKRIAACQADNRSNLAAKLSRIGHWELGDYQPFRPTSKAAQPREVET